MTKTLHQEFNELQSIRKSFSFFSKKTQSLSKLKLSFFEKMKQAETDENIEVAHQYFSYLIRTTNLSEKIYVRVEQELKQYIKYLESISIQEIRDENPSMLDIEIQEIIGLISQFLQELKIFVKQTLDGKHNISSMNQIINEEKRLLEEIDHHPATFFQELEIQKQLHQLYLKESEISIEFINNITTLEKHTTTFAQRIQIKIKQLNATFTQFTRELKAKPLKTIFNPFESAGIKLEKNASIFAATIFGLSIVANVSTLLGIGSAAIICREIILLLAEVGEPLQAIPALKSMTSRFKGTLIDAKKRALQSISTLQAQYQ